MLGYAMPCHATPCHAMPCHATPCHAMLCHAMPCQAAHALDSSLVCVTVTAIKEQHVMLRRAAVLARRLRGRLIAGGGKGGAKHAASKQQEAATSRAGCFAPPLLRAEYISAQLAAPIRAEDVVRDAGWARVVSLGAMSAEVPPARVEPAISCLSAPVSAPTDQGDHDQRIMSSRLAAGGGARAAAPARQA
jgi:hypothetical protein